MPTLRENNNSRRYFKYNRFNKSKPSVSKVDAAIPGLKTPTLRGAFPKEKHYSLSYEGIKNSRVDFDRSMKIKNSAAKARQQKSNYATKSFSVNNFNNGIYGNKISNTRPSKARLENIKYFSGGKINAGNSGFEGNAARTLESQPAVRSKKSNRLDRTRDFRAVKGQQQRGIMQTNVLSPLLVTVAKFATAIVIVVAIMAFARVALTSATVATGISSQNLNKQIENEILTKSNLEVQDSTLGNSGRIRSNAQSLNMISPTNIEKITLGQDILAYDDNGNISLVDSLNRVSNSAK